MMLRLLSWPYVRKHAVRSVLTLVAIVIGVAVFVAMRSANAAVLAAFEETINRVAGATELQVTSGDVGFDEEVLEQVQSLREVRVAAPVIESVVGTGLPGQGNLLVLGVDMTGDRSLRDYNLEAGDEAIIDDPLLFLAQPDSLMVSDTFAQRNGLTLESKVPLQTSDGTRPFTVRGILRSGGLSSAFGGNLAIMDIYAAQHVFGRGRKFDRIDLAVNKGADVPAVQKQLQTLLGPGFEVQPPSSRGQSFQSMLRIYRFALVFASGFALLVGMFIIYNAFAISVAQRRGEIGLLRALGATRGQIWRLFVAESLVFGLIGSAIGIALGQLGAGVMARVATSLVQGLYGVGLETITALTPEIVGLALAVGLLTSGIAAAFPARAAARVDPVQALQKGRGQVLPQGYNRRRIILASVLGVAGAVTLLASDTMPAFYLGYLGMMSGALIMTPILALALTRAIRPLLCWVRPVEGALAADSLIAAPKRTAATVIALMLSLTLVIGLAGTARSSYAAITGWVDVTLNPDLFVTSSATLTDRNYRFPDSMTAELSGVEGVGEVQPVRNVRLQMNDQPMLLIAVDNEKAVRRSPRHVLQGDGSTMFRLAAEGQGVYSSENFATLRHVTVGARLDIPSPTGLVSLPLVGIIRDFGDQQGALFIERTLYVERWKDDSIDFFRVYVAPGASPVKVKADILAKFSGNRRLFVLENAEVRQYVNRLTGQFFSMSWAQLAVAMIVAVLGIVNSMTVSVTDRKRELGILRAVGGFRNQVRWTIWMEAIGVAIVSVILGISIGALHLYCQLEMTARDYPGMRFDYMYPFTVAAALFPVIMLTALVGAVVPAESAVRGSLVEALEYE